MDIKQLTDILLLMKQEAATIVTEDDLKLLMRKYDILFLGENFNTIYSHELAHSLKNKLNFDTTIEEVNEMIPQACRALGMKCEAMYSVKDVHDGTVEANRPDVYQISL